MSASGGIQGIVPLGHASFNLYLYTILSSYFPFVGRRWCGSENYNGATTRASKTVMICAFVYTLSRHWVDGQTNGQKYGKVMWRRASACAASCRREI